MNFRKFVVPVLLLVAFLASTGCAAVYRVRRPHEVTLMTSNQASNTYVAQSQAATLPGQIKPSAVLLQIDEKGAVKVIGLFFNTHPFPLVLDVSRYDVCFGSELWYERPAQDDPCWRPAGTIQDIVIPPYSGSSPWIRVPANGGYQVFVYRYNLNAGQIAEQVVKLAIDFYAQDNLCPGNRLVDFYWAAGWDLARHGWVPYCQSTRLLR